jgi:SAM-dependent methyltransferase
VNEVVRRERAFYDERWQETRIRRIDEPLVLPGQALLAGAKLLVCSCGSGREPVKAANSGAEVYCFDVSSVAVRKAMEVAQANDVLISAQVMDFNSLAYPDNFFDIIFGSAILHHVDCQLAGREIYRCLRPGGTAFFSENSDRNSLLRWLRRGMFGRPGAYQGRDFLFFHRRGTTDEYPLTEAEVATLARAFDGHLRRVYTQFYFFRLLAYLTEPGYKPFSNLMRWLDNWIYRHWPWMGRYGFVQWVVMQKPARPGSPDHHDDATGSRSAA